MWQTQCLVAIHVREHTNICKSNTDAWNCRKFRTTLKTSIKLVNKMYFEYLNFLYFFVQFCCEPQYWNSFFLFLFNNYFTRYVYTYSTALGLLIMNILTDLPREDGEAVQKESKNSTVLGLRCGSKAIPSKGLYSV